MKLKRKTIPPLKCFCGKVALYHVYRVGYCKEHYEDAVKDMKQVREKQKAFAIADGFKRSK